MTNLFNQPVDSMPCHRIPIFGRTVTTVQRVSRYCLNQGIEILPYYGIPTVEEVNLFAPNLLILCLPAPENFFLQIDRPCILWSERFVNVKLPVASSCIELKNLLQQTLQL